MGTACYVRAELLQFAWLKLALWELTAQESGPRGGSLSPSHQKLAIEPPHPWVLLHSGAPVTLAWAGHHIVPVLFNGGFWITLHLAPHLTLKLPHRGRLPLTTELLGSQTPSTSISRRCTKGPDEKRLSPKRARGGGRVCVYSLPNKDNRAQAGETFTLTTLLMNFHYMPFSLIVSYFFQSPEFSSRVFCIIHCDVQSRCQKWKFSTATTNALYQMFFVFFNPIYKNAG